MAELAGRSLPAPRVLLLDFGGVIVDGPTSPTWVEEAAACVARLLSDGGIAAVPAPLVQSSLRAADVTSNAPNHALEPWSEQFWSNVVTAEWPGEARRGASERWAQLSRCVGELKYARTWAIRPHVAKLLAAAESLGLAMAIVSNAVCGDVHRDALNAAGLSRYFAAEIYSDEVNVRKPDPRIVWVATAALRAAPKECWFVGDTISRDVVVARRSGCAAAILMTSRRSEPPPYRRGESPDAIVADPDALHRLLEWVCS